MTTHRPSDFTSGLGAKLASRSRHVCVFLGAGASRACGLPDIAQLEAMVRGQLNDEDAKTFDSLLKGRNLEQVLSRLRRIAALVSGTETVDGLTAARAAALDTSICYGVVQSLGIDPSHPQPMQQFAAWAARSDYLNPIEIFTVNYDLLIERALEEHAAMYFDGFVGNLEARFRTDLVEAAHGDPHGYVSSRFVRLWKVHGSINWVRTQANEIMRIGQHATGSPAAIYPSDTKYEEARRVPFLVLLDRFRRALHQPETIVLVAGYSFGDDHLNELLFDAALHRERSEFVFFSFGEVDDSIADRALRTPNIQLVGRTEAVLGGVRGGWIPPTAEESTYWADGMFTLPDFARLAEFLGRIRAQERGTGYDA